MTIYWFVQAIAYFSIVIFLVPYNYIKKLLPFAFIGGFVYTWIVHYIAVDILNYWEFPPDLFMVLGIPFFFVLSWFAVTLLYGYLLFQYPKDQLWIIAFFLIWTTINTYISVTLNQVIFASWSVAQTFMFAIFSHILLLYLLKLMHQVEELGTKEHMVSYSLAILKNRK